LQFCSKFLGFSGVVLKTIDLPVKIEENRLNLKQNKFEGEFVKTRAKIKVEQIEGETPTPQIILQKPNLNIKIEHVEEKIDLEKLNMIIKVEHVKEQIDLQKPILNIKVKEGSKTYTINKFYNQRFKKYLNYH